VRTAALVICLVALPSIARAGNGAFVPPMRVDVGPTSSHVEPVPGLQVVAGIHWASLYPKPRANIDIGVGMVCVTHGGDDDDMAAARTSGAPERERLGMFGGYVEVATRTAGGSWWRNWVGTRVESGRATIDGRKRAYVGVATRVSTEAFVSGGSSGSGGVAVGVLAIGLYGELSARRIDDVGNDLGASFGVSMRVPLIVD
jgi:hypothetical protein